MDILNLIKENYAVLVPALYIIGMFLKGNSKVPDWTIPWVLLVCGIGFSVWMTGFVVQSVIQGILVTGAAVLGNQLFKQTTEGIKGNKAEEVKEIESTDSKESKD